MRRGEWWSHGNAQCGFPGDVDSGATPTLGAGSAARGPISAVSGGSQRRGTFIVDVRRNLVTLVPVAIKMINKHLTGEPGTFQPEYFPSKSLRKMRANSHSLRSAPQRRRPKRETRQHNHCLVRNPTFVYAKHHTSTLW